MPRWYAAHRSTLRTALGKLDYDLVLIDAPPSLSGLTRSALVASDRAVVVTEAGAFAVNAVTRLFAAIDEIRRTEAGGLQPLGIVLNRYKPSMAEQRAQRAALERAFGLVRDLIVFTDRRMILVDKQGVTGKKTEYHSVPYAKISHFSVETAGTLDMDSELKVAMSGGAVFTRTLGRGVDIGDVQKVLASYVLA